MQSKAEVSPPKAPFLRKKRAAAVVIRMKIMMTLYRLSRTQVEKLRSFGLESLVEVGRSSRCSVWEDGLELLWGGFGRFPFGRSWTNI